MPPRSAFKPAIMAYKPYYERYFHKRYPILLQQHYYCIWPEVYFFFCTSIRSRKM